MGNSLFLELIVAFPIGMTFFNSFFGMSYLILMPIFAVGILKVGAEGPGMLLNVGGGGASLTSLRFGSQSNVSHRGLLMIGGGELFGSLIAAFALTSRFVGSFPLALVILFLPGFANSTCTINVQSFLHTLVPDRIREAG